MKGQQGTHVWSTDPIVTVCAASGLQGSSVVDAILQTGIYI